MSRITMMTRYITLPFSKWAIQQHQRAYDDALDELNDATERLHHLTQQQPYGKARRDIHITQLEVQYREARLRQADQDLTKCRRRYGR
jgi:hypothetical protein